MLDVHTLCHLPEHWGCEWSKNWQPVYGHEYETKTPEQYDEAMSAAGVDLAFVFGMRATRAGVITPNEHVEKFVAETSTPTIGFMALDLGDPDVLGQLVMLRKSRNVFADVSAAWARPYDGYRALVRAQEWGVVNKLLFGSDYPMWTPAEAVDGDPRTALGVNS
jgi:hypothetical protein